MIYDYAEDLGPKAVPINKQRRKPRRVRVKRDNTGMRKLTVAWERTLYKAVAAFVDKVQEPFDLFVENAVSAAVSEPLPEYDERFKHYQERARKTFGLWLTDEVYAHLVAAARQRRTTCGAIIREALHTWLALNGAEVHYALS